MNKIYILEEDKKELAAIKDALGSGYQIEAFDASDDLLNKIGDKRPDLLILDYDLKNTDGLGVFKKVKNLAPGLSVIMLSLSGSIPLAVSATKLGAADFLSKPLVADNLRQSVQRVLGRGQDIEAMNLTVLDDPDWLVGQSRRIKEMLSLAEAAINAKKDIILIGERGIDKTKLALLLHKNSRRGKKKLSVIDLNLFKDPGQEAHFWTTLQEITAEPTLSSVQSDEDLCGTLLLDNFEALEDHFKVSLLNFLKERPGKIDKEFRAIIGIFDEKSLEGIKHDLAVINIPPLRRRKDDLAVLVSAYLAKWSKKRDRDLSYVSTDVLEMLSIYDFPGNFNELETLIKRGALNAAGQGLGLEDLPLDYSMIKEKVLEEVFISNDLRLEKARLDFEKNFYGIILKKTRGDESAAARFLDIPKTVFSQRIRELGLAS